MRRGTWELRVEDRLARLEKMLLANEEYIQLICDKGQMSLEEIAEVSAFNMQLLRVHMENSSHG